MLMMHELQMYAGVNFHQRDLNFQELFHTL